MEATSKITTNHLKRTAYLYIRQSTVRQVFENTESTKRQYDLKRRAVALGWHTERIEVIDTDLGKSGSTAVDRQGFQKLVAEVGLGWAGIVMGLEVSRLARNSMDWHRLIEICALTNTLILDEDGIYDPTDFNDRLLLGLKGTMSEAETHVLRARLRGGLLNKARRGELRCQLPVGLLYDINGKVILNPDQQVQASLHLVFETFLRTGTAHRTARHFRDNGLLFPRKIISGADKGKVIWGPVTVKRVLEVLHNPRYAGAYSYGRGQWKKKLNGERKKWEVLPKDRWQVLIPDAHPGYISWQQYEDIALLIEDVTLLKKEQIIVQVRYRGGKTTTLKLPLPLNAWQGLKTPKHVLTKMDELFNKYTDSQVADKLNLQGLKSGAGNDFSAASVRWARYSAGLKSFADRLKESGLLTSKQMGIQLGVSETTVISWRKKGLLQGRRCNDKNQWLYFPDSKEKINDNQWVNKKSLERTVGGAV